MIGEAAFLRLYMPKKQKLSCISNINTCLRKNKQNHRITVSEVLNEQLVHSIIEHNEGFNVLKKSTFFFSIVGSEKKELMAMILQLGPPTSFLTICSSKQLARITKILENQTNKIVPLKMLYRVATHINQN